MLPERRIHKALRPGDGDKLLQHLARRRQKQRANQLQRRDRPPDGQQYRQGRHAEGELAGERPAPLQRRLTRFVVQYHAHEKASR